MNRTRDETSRALLAAARRLLSTEGVDALTVRRIASEAGMSTMNVYSRFGGKDGIVDELHNEGLEQLRAALDATPVTGDAVADLTAAAHRYRRFATQHPRYYEIMFGPSTPDASSAAQGFSERLRRAVDTHTIELPADLDVAAAAIWLWATCHGMVSLELNGALDETTDWSAVYEGGVRVVIAGLTAGRDRDP